MKNKLVAMLLTLTMTLSLVACGGKESSGTFDKSSLTDALSAAASVTSEKTASAAASEKSAADAEKTANNGVRVEKSKTPYGNIDIPRFDESKLNSKDAAMANEMFESLRDWMLERVEECKTEWGDESYHDAAEPLCDTQISETGRIISVLVHYVALYPYSSLEEYYVAVNFDAVTGNVLDPHEVIKGSGFTQAEVKAALGCYAELCHNVEWEHETFYDAAGRGIVLDGIGDPSSDWYNETKELVDNYDAQMPPQGNPWDELPCWPTVYVTEDGLQVGFAVPSAAGSGSYDAMVHIGHDNTETIYLNPNNAHGMPFGRGALTSSAAAEGLILHLDLDENCTIEDDAMTLIENDAGETEPAYAYRVTRNGGAAKRYAVGVFTGTEWEKDDSGWKTQMNGTGLLPEDVVSVAHGNGSLAAIWNEPGDYGCWATNPRTEVDLIAYSSDSNHDMQDDCHTLALFAVEDNTVVTFEGGAMEGDGFAPAYQYISLTLNSGESVVIYCMRPQNATQAITVSTPNDTGRYILQFADPEYTAEFEYITSDSAAG